MKRYIVWTPCSRGPNMRYDVWRILKETDDIGEAVAAWEKTIEEDEAMLTGVVREMLHE